MPYMSENQAEAEMLISQALAIQASGASASARQALGESIRDFLMTNETWLEAQQADAFDADGNWYSDQLDSAWAFVTGNQIGTWKQPNRLTSTAAKPKDDSLSKEIFSQKFADDFREGIGPAFEGIGKGLTKGMGALAVKLAAAGAVGWLLYVWVMKKKG